MTETLVEAMVDGITIQHAGELLLDEVTTTEVRRNSASTYIRSAEDFAFAMVYFDGLIFSGSGMPWQQGPSPGDALLKRFPGLVRTGENGAPMTPADLLTMFEFRNRIAKDFANLERAVEIAEKFFRAYFSREARVYLGQHDTLSQPRLSPDNYIYGVFNASNSDMEASQPRIFLTDRELQSKVPPKVISRLAEFISKDIRRDACPEAISEFITRSLLSHVVVLRWREYQAESSPEGFINVVPHCTRAAIIQADLERSFPEWLETQRALVIPALGMILKTRPQTRDQLIERIGDIRNVKPIPKIRKAVGDFLREERPAHKKKLLNEMRRKLNLEAERPDEVLASQITFTAGVPGLSAQVKGNAVMELRDQLPLSRGAAFRRLSAFSREIHSAGLRRICPELGYSDPT